MPETTEQLKVQVLSTTNQERLGQKDGNKSRTSRATRGVEQTKARKIETETSLQRTRGVKQNKAHNQKFRTSAPAICSESGISLFPRIEIQIVFMMLNLLKSAKFV